MTIGELAVHSDKDKKHEGLANSTQTLNSFMATGTGLPNMDTMATEIMTDLTNHIVVLQGQVNDMKPLVKKAKELFHTDRKNIRDNYKACKKEIRRDKHSWKDTQQCAPFAGHFPAFLQVQKDDEVMIKDHGTQVTQGRRRAGPTRHQEKKQERAAAKAAKCSEMPKCELRQAKRTAKQAALQDYKQVKDQDKQDKQQLRAAKFQKVILPKIIKILKPELLGAYKVLDATGSAGSIVKACGQALADDEKTGCIPMLEIDLVTLLENYLKLFLNNELTTELGSVFSDIESKIWKIFDPLESALANSIIGEVGSIPFVGGVLAAAVGVLFDAIYDVLQKAVNHALNKLKTLLQADIVKAVVDAVMATGLFTPKALKDPTQTAALSTGMETSGNAAAQGPVSSTTKKVNAEASAAQAKAQVDAKGAQAQIMSAGNEVSNQTAQDNQEEQNMLSSENEEDVNSAEGAA